MVPGEPPLGAGEPYSWDESVQIPVQAQQMWKEVANGIDKSQTVVWKNAVESLESANRYLGASEDARRFVEGYMLQVIGILVEQQPSKIGQHERSCVEESLELATMIIAKDIKIQEKRKGESSLLGVLALILNRKKAYYKGSKGNWNVTQLSGLPEVRLRMIDRFHAEGGFAILADYLSARINTPLFPSLEFLHQILNALSDAVPNRHTANDDKSPAKEKEDHAIMVSQAVMDYMNSFTDETLKKQPPELINTCRYCLQRIFDRLIVSRRKQTYMFYAFWRSLILKLITSRSLPLRLTGWEQLKECIEASQEHRPPPKMFVVSNAGVTFVNGIFSFAGVVTADGYAQRGEEICYKRRVPPSENDGGKDLTLFRCTMRSQQKWWFLSEADEEQPGTDRDIDYYQHKSKEHEETEPPPRGWVTCRNSGIDPPPHLRGRGLMVPKGEEYNTLEHLLARWAIENKIVELVLGASLHREVVNRSTPLIEFLASMCERDEAAKSVPDGTSGPNAFCLKADHLLLAWRTCASKADAAVSEEIYQLLVSILPSLSNPLAIPLFQAVQATLNDPKGNSLFEVAEFCGALATSANIDAKAGNVGVHYFRSEDVRSEALKLLWAVLTHPNASALKNYDILKQYVTNELRIDPLGRVHREKFLESCTKSLSLNTEQKAGGTPVDEFLALRMVKLTLFVLEACPPDQAMLIVNASQGYLASLLFNELTAYLSRRKADVKASLMQKRTSVGSVDASMDNAAALYERLRILRYVYGVSESVKLSIVQLQQLWQLCDIPADREEVMVFVAHASTFGNLTDSAVPDAAPAPLPQGQSDSSLSAAFSDEVRASAFLDLFCSQSVNWGELGEGAYKSFHLMFKKLRQSPGSSIASSGPSLDALWRICLTAGNENVAIQSMKDLLAVYAAMATVDKTHNAWSAGPPSSVSEQMQTDESDENFGNRVFGCLAEVKKGLDAGDPSSERSAERCLRILNAAVGQDGSIGRSITGSTVSLLSSLPINCTLSDAMKLLPHGMRGQSSYRRIGVMAKRTTSHNTQGPQQMSDRESQGSSRQQSTVRFSLDVHPLETLGSVKLKVAHHCQCRVTSVKPISASGRLAGTGKGGDSSQMNLNVFLDDSTVDQLGIAHGCEMVFVIADRQSQGASSPSSTKTPARKSTVLDLTEIFGDPNNEFAAKIFQTLLSVLEALPLRTEIASSNSSYKLVWDLLLAMPTNAGVSSIVRSTAGISGDSMLVDSMNAWTSVIDQGNFQRSVYVMQAIESFLQPAPEVVSILPTHKIGEFEKAMKADSTAFRRGFIDSGGFTTVINFFSGSGATRSADQTRSRMANAAALRILKCCLFGNNKSTPLTLERTTSSDLDEVGVKLLESLSGAEGLLRNLTAMVVFDQGISTSTISDVLKFLRLLFRSTRTSETFIALPNRMAEKFVITLLLWEGGPESARSSSAMSTSSKIRKNMHDLVLSIQLLARHTLPWLINALDSIDVASDATSEYFDVLKKLVADDESNLSAAKASSGELKALGTAVCRKVACCPRPTNGSATIDVPTGVLCGCVKLLRALIENGGGAALSSGTRFLLNDLGIARWSETSKSSSNDAVLIDLMGAIFDGFLSPGGSSSVVAICCDKESRQLGFDAVAAAARSCGGTDGYMALVSRINKIVLHAAPYVRHRWGQLGNAEEGQTRSSLRNPSKYSGLRNQGCTCYMNSFLQQLFMMPALRKEMCAAPLPTSLRTSGGGMASNGADIIGKKISLQWDTGVSYDAMVEGFDEASGMHVIRYCPLLIANVSGLSNHIQPDDIGRMPPELKEEFFLSEGRPGKETGVFEVITKSDGEHSGEGKGDTCSDDSIKESEDEAAARHLFEEVQRTFIHLDEGSRGRCFDPRALVEACACLKLEFDVWQQNDASEFAMKLLDRMEIVLKKWAPTHFHFLEHTFGLKQTKQKICKKCSLTTNREESLMSIDCQIRGKTDIHEALATMCEVEYMEGNNKVFCDRCKENTDTVLKTAISALPDILILSLKRFDLDYNTFETVKLNSRLAFGQTLNMKRYTLEGIEAVEKAYIGKDPGGGPSPMDTSEDGANTVDLDPLSTLSDEDYEYKLAGVLVHAGVAQGGHYYSFIKDRASKFDADHKWYRFDDEDVTPWDPASLEVECFGGKVKKETKWPNGQVHTVESEQFANALMVFYEKVKPAEHKHSDKSKKEDDQDEPMKVEELDVSKMTGFEAFEPDVLRSNATHRWQTFLFDSEFQAFLKGLLGLCRNPRNQEDRMDTSTSPVSNGSPKMAWKVVIIDMLVTFFLDVFLYSSDRTWLQQWVRTLSEIFLSNRDSAQMFVRKLAAKTATVSANWLRTYLSDCPESDARLAAVQVMGSAIQSCVSLDMEQSALQRWSKAYVEQLVGIEKFGTGPLPTRLRGKWKSCENSNLFSKGEASSIGVVISFLTVLIEAAPRTWKYNADMCAFIRDISNAKPDSGGRVLVEALQQAQIPARLTCLVTRDKAPILLRVAFPGASVPLDVVETQLRQETNPNAHLLPLGGNQMMTSTDKMPMPSDYISLFEALGVLAGMKGLVLAPLVVETDVQRSRPSIVLSDAATIALTQIYRESCTAGMPGMGQREIDNYLQRCSVDSASMPTQKIVDIMAKYPCTDNTGKGTSCLSLEGFLAYYRENAQTQEARVRVDLHTFGFRPDLTRRSHDTRSVSAANGREQPRHTTESVCIDVASLLGTQGGAEKLGTVAELGLSVFELYSTAYAACEPLAEYLLATAAFEHDSSALIKNTLACLRFAPTGWAGSEVYHAALMVLKVLSSIPDRFQQDRIKEIMQCPEGSGLQDDQGVGLLRAAKSVAGLRSTQNYPNELQYVYERYVEVFKELLKLRSVFLWMDDNRELWSWMERDVLRTEESSSQRQSRGDYSVRRDGDARTASLLDPPRSDSDMHGVNDSEDDEDESVYDESKYRPERVIVQGAGLDVINGIYYREGLFENAGKYTKEGNWKGVDDIFSLFRCNVSNNTKHWYISIVPPGVQPGTNTDIDFYSAPMNEQNPDVPPARGWTKANEGQGQPPTVSVPRDERPDIEVEPRGRPKDQDRGPRTFI